MLKWTKKTFAAVRGNESLRIECKAQETKQLGDQKRERKTSWRHCHASFSVLLWGNIRREKKESDFYGEILSFCTNSTHCYCCISPEVVTPILEALSLRYHLSFGHFRYQRVSYIRGRSVGLLYQRFESPFFYQRDSSSSFRRKSFLLHLDLYLFPHWFQIWIASHVNLNKDEFYGQSL